MLNGASFGKKFGEPTNASGEVDGTNGEDFFRVWIICENETGSKDSIEFYLADYRFTDNTEDYIIDTWETVDLIEVFAGGASKVSMRFESSDIGDFGMNTPAYIAIDNILWEAPLSIAEANESDFTTYPNPVQDKLVLKGPKGTISLTTMSGRNILEFAHNTNSSIDFSALPSGVYVLNIATDNGTVTKKIVK